MPSIPSPLPTPSTLTPSALSSLLALYAPTLAHLASTKRAPKSASSLPDLPALDLLRYTTIPARVRARRTDASAHSAADGDATAPGPHGWLEKDELELLVAWKLTRGHSRPALPALIRANAPALVRSTTARAYALFATATAAAAAAEGADPFPALKVLAQLRGVGPATASLLLAVGWPGEVPFFADELWGWLRGGEAKLRYDWREYGEVWEGVRGVREGLGVGLGVGAEEVERGAWVVGMVGKGRGVDVQGGGAPGGQAVVAGHVGVEEVEKGRGKRKAGGGSVETERTAKVPRRRKVETSKEEKAADGSVPRRSTRSKQ
ncbi:hypothetical protein MMC15_000406 [Xylographa vitiligo]|nr:hypothetical protein [Xylographa vitiligo]